MNIEVVLIQDDPKLGKRGDVLKVSPGFAQNFLYPNHKARPATESNLKPFQDERVRGEKEEAGRLMRAREIAKKLSEISVAVEAAAGEGDKLFGAVTSADISQALARQGVTIDKKEIHLDEPLKKLGAYEVEARLHRDVQSRIKIRIVKRSGS